MNLSGEAFAHINLNTRNILSKVREQHPDTEFSFVKESEKWRPILNSKVSKSKRP